MDAQERLARRLERAKQLTKLKKEEEQQRANGFIGLKDDKLKGKNFNFNKRWLYTS